MIGPSICTEVKKKSAVCMYFVVEKTEFHHVCPEYTNRQWMLYNCSNIFVFHPSRAFECHAFDFFFLGGILYLT